MNGPLPDGRGSERPPLHEQNRDREGAAAPNRDRKGAEQPANGRGPLADVPASARSGKAIPLAYLITFRTYGTWLHGDARGSVDRAHNIYATPLLPPDAEREQAARRRCRQAPVTLDAGQRRIVQQAVLEVIERKSWSLHELNVRSNHVHAVVSAPEHPDRVVNTLKSISTRRLRESGLLDATISPWVRGASRKYLWTREGLESACRYVLDGPGEDL